MSTPKVTTSKKKTGTTIKTATVANMKYPSGSGEKKKSRRKPLAKKTEEMTGPVGMLDGMLKASIDFSFLREQLSNHTWQQVFPAVDAVLAGKIPLTIPLYAVINGVLTLVQDVLQPIKAIQRGFKLGFAALEMMILASVVKLVGNMFGQSLREKDNHFFKEALTESLQSLLKTHSEEEPLYGAVQTLKENVTGSFGGNELASQFLYLKAVADVLSQPDSEKRISAESLEQYAAQLEKEGRADAAAHVRQAVSGMAVAGDQLRS